MLLFALTAIISTPVFAATNDCAQSRSALLTCVSEGSPQLKEARLNIQRLKTQEDAAGQWLNPTFGLNTIRGSMSGSRNSETDLNLSFPVEIGGKISARRAVARSQTAGGEAALYEAEVKIRVEALINLNRYRQALHEREVIAEAIESFSTLIKQYANRGRLSPEQETSEAVYRMAKNDYQLKSTALSNELVDIENFFLVNAGVGEGELLNLLPQSPKEWPEVTPVGDLSNAPRIRSLAANVGVAEAELSSARSQSWPTLLVGPSARIQSQANSSGTLWGLNVGIGVPLFNTNAAARAAAVVGVQATQTVKELGLSIEENSRLRAKQVYLKSVELVKASSTHAELEAAHKKLDKTLNRGLVPSALIIEAHRSHVDLERTRNESELSALRALYELYAIDGKILERNE